MEGRQYVLAGRFKSRVTRAGAMIFVTPEAVLGTLEQRFAWNLPGVWRLR